MRVSVEENPSSGVVGVVESKRTTPTKVFPAVVGSSENAAAGVMVVGSTSEGVALVAKKMKG
ncbi:hypothetical protein SESBI_45773 [Sesbania bispinosa]|nr:hypothetical protein SESBI_45773 [Sesbania bispinosa]